MQQSTKTKVFKFLTRMNYVLAVVFLITGLVMNITQVQGASSLGKPDNPKKVWWCHWTQGGHYNLINISWNALEQAGHVDAQGWRRSCGLHL